MDTKRVAILLTAFLIRVISDQENFVCDFQTSFCGLVQDQQDDFDWTRHKGKTSSHDTGPDKDNSLGTTEGYYIYIETSYGSLNDIARLVGPYINCYTSTITFSYHMYGTDINKLVLYAVGYDGHNKTIWSKSGNKGEQWHNQTLQITSEVKWKIVIEGHKGASYRGDIAVDDLKIACLDPITSSQDTTSSKDSLTTDDTASSSQRPTSTTTTSLTSDYEDTTSSSQPQTTSTTTTSLTSVYEDTTSSSQPPETSTTTTPLTSDYEESTFSTTFQTTATKTCKCPCKQIGDLSLVNMTSQQLASVIEQTKKELQVNKSQLASFIRKKISVKDGRVTSKAIGAIGVVFLLFIGFFLVGIDILRVFGKVSQNKNAQTRN